MLLLTDGVMMRNEEHVSCNGITLITVKNDSNRVYTKVSENDLDWATVCLRFPSFILDCNMMPLPV